MNEKRKPATQIAKFAQGVAMSRGGWRGVLPIVAVMASIVSAVAQVTPLDIFGGRLGGARIQAVCETWARLSTLARFCVTGYVSDAEFGVTRDPFGEPCDAVGPELARDQLGERFSSRWIAQ